MDLYSLRVRQGLLAWLKTTLPAMTCATSALRWGGSMLLIASLGAASGFAGAQTTFQGPGIYSGIKSGSFGDWLGGTASAGAHARFLYNDPGQSYEVTAVGAGGAYFQIKNISWSNAGASCLAYDSSGYLSWVVCPTAAAPNTNAQFAVTTINYTCSPESGTNWSFVSSPSNCMVQGIDSTATTPSTDAWAHSCDLPSACIHTSNMFKGGSTATLTAQLHLLMTQADSNSVPDDNSTTRTITVTSCKNATIGTCDPVTSDSGTVTVSIVSGTGTLSATSVQLVSGVGSFTVKSGTANTVQLKVVPGNASYPGATGTCNRNGALTGETTWTSSNADCAVVFAPAGPDHYEIVTPSGATASPGPANLTVKACADATCSSLSATNGTVTLTATKQSGTQVGTLSTTTPTLANGTVALTISNTLDGVTRLTVAAGTAPAPLNTMQCYKGTTRNATTSCDVTFTVVPNKFDVVEQGAASGSRLHTKLASTAFSVDVLAVKSDGTLETGYTGSVTLELVDGATGAGVCASRTALATPPTLSPTSPYTFVSGNAGRKTFTVTLAKAAPNLYFRVKDATNSVTSCSTDNFSLRPGAVTLNTTPAPMANGPSHTAMPTIKAGAAFTLSAATATSATDGYAGTLTLDTSKLSAQTTAQDAAQQAGGVVGTLTPATLTTNALGVDATYSEVGYLYLADGAYRDGSYTSVDYDASADIDCVRNSASVTANAGGLYGCNIGNVSATGYVAFGRFVPDRFGISNTAVAEAGGSFSYFGQEFTTGFTLTALNVAGNATQNYAGVYARLDPMSYGSFGFTATFAPAGASTFGTSATAPTGSWIGGVANVVAKHQASRPGAVVAPTGVTVYAQPTDADGVTSVKTSLGASSMRYGVLMLSNVYGSELLPLYVPIRAMYWSGSAWLPNTLDSTTTIAVSNITVGHRKSNLLANNPALGITIPTPTLSAGQTAIRVAAPGVDNIGSIDIAISLGATGLSASCATSPAQLPNAASGASMTWLRGNWCGNAFANDPSATVTFGAAKSPYYYRRER